MDIQNYIMPELLILIPVCWGFGLMIKSTPLNNQWIPLVLGALCVSLSALWVFASSRDNIAMGFFIGITQGVLCWLVAWLSYDKLIKK